MKQNNMDEILYMNNGASVWIDLRKTLRVILSGEAMT